MERTDTSPDEFISTLPDSVRDDVATLDVLLSEVFAGHERVMWEGPMWGGTAQRIIGYGALLQARPKGDPIDWFQVGLALQKNYISLYVSGVDDGQYLVKQYADRLGKVKVGSANVTFTRLADVDQAALREMVARARELLDTASA
jgi:hypothetical protein